MRTLKCLLLSGVLICAANAWAAFPYPDTLLDGSINVGRAGQFTALSAGDINYYDTTVTGPSLIRGNVGVGGKANFSMSDGIVDGNVYMNSFGKFTMSGPAHFTPGHGLITNQDTVLNGALSDARNLSSSAAMDHSTGSYTVTMGSFNGMTENGNKSVSLLGTGKIVLNLTDFVMTGGTFTLAGNANTTYIINISRNFSLNNAKIVLADVFGNVNSSTGVQASHVLFNVLGTGSQVSLNQGTSMTGILLAVQRKVDLSGGKVFGRVIGDQINVTSGGQIVSQ